MSVSPAVARHGRIPLRGRLEHAATVAARALVPLAWVVVAAVGLTGGARVALLVATPAVLYAVAGARLPRRSQSAILLLAATVTAGSGLILRRELLVAAGFVLLAAGARAGWGVNRGIRRRRAWAYRVLTGLAALPLAVYVAVPALQTVNYVGKPREPISDAALGLPHERVGFEAADGVRLSGWFVPGSRDAAVVVVHGGGGDREGAAAHARMLASAGFAVLAYDARGRGESDGDHNAFGWQWDRDVRGAVDYLERRGFDRIAALGLSTGAEAAITAAASDPRIRAVIADGVQGRQPADAEHLSGLEGLLLRPAMAAGALGVRLASGEPLPEPMLDVIHRVAATRPLLLIASASFEIDWNRAYAESTGAQLWELPESMHTRGLRDHPAEYRTRVTAVLDSALGGSAPPPQGLGMIRP